MEQRTVTIKNFSRITKIVQVSAMKVHFQIAERSLFYLNPDIQHRRMTYPPERETRWFRCLRLFFFPIVPPLSRQQEIIGFVILKRSEETNYLSKSYISISWFNPS